ncbi:hypothetical protein EYF80_018145 [Liparis tanakae]|uniref:Uncharacterized protein n=1 Tax=Liparis tanakae TaxID=230148 RepID=A0A4Z2I1D5_9TELE|nr:hypothetical protein EYF80_018145 [Liparis tanakae]
MAAEPSVLNAMVWVRWAQLQSEGSFVGFPAVKAGARDGAPRRLPRRCRPADQTHRPGEMFLDVAVSVCGSSAEHRRLLPLPPPSPPPSAGFLLSVFHETITSSIV